MASISPSATALGVGRLRLVGTRSMETCPETQIKRVRIIRRAGGYCAPFCVDAERHVEHVPTGKQTGIDMGLSAFSADSDGNSIEYPRHQRKAATKLKRRQQRVSRKKKGSNICKKARQALAKQ